MSNAIVDTQSAVALPSSVMDRLRSQAKDVAAKERPAIGKISLRAGVLSYSGNPMPGNKMEAVILEAAYRNVMYVGKFDPDNVTNPNCFAFALSDENMTPHENVSVPPNGTCKGCPYDEWGSAGGNSRGKACKQTRRLVMLPASALESVDSVKSAEMAVMDIPVTSVRNYSNFVNTLSATAGVPPYAAITSISVSPNVKTQFEVKFQPMRVVPSEAVLLAIESRIEQAQSISLEPYAESAPFPSQEEMTAEAEKAAAAASKKKKF